MSQITLSFRVLLVVLTFLMLTAVAANAQSPKRSGVAKLFGMTQENKARCGLRPKQSGFSNFVAEYETYRLRGTSLQSRIVAIRRRSHLSILKIRHLKSGTETDCVLKILTAVCCVRP